LPPPFVAPSSYLRFHANSHSGGIMADAPDPKPQSQSPLDKEQRQGLVREPAAVPAARITFLSSRAFFNTSTSTSTGGCICHRQRQPACRQCCAS
jgi:hypothetical protein